jgi:AcrR family transcriptional regulator
MTSETYDKILQTARRLFVQKGYTATSMRQVAAEAGIGKATIYHHFPDKQSIIMALLEQNQAKIQENLAIMRAETDPRRQFQVSAELSIKYLLDSADLLQIARREVPGGREFMMGGFGAFMHEFRLLLSDAIQRGIEQGIFRAVDPAQAARVFLTMIQGSFAMVYLSGERPQSPEQTATTLLDVFFKGIDVRPGE